REICPGLAKPLCCRNGEIRGGVAGLSHSKRSYERYPKGGGPSGKSRSHVPLGGPVRIAEPLPAGGGTDPERGAGSAGPVAGEEMSRYPGRKGCARRTIRRASFSFPEAMELKCDHCPGNENCGVREDRFSRFSRPRLWDAARGGLMGQA